MPRQAAIFIGERVLPHQAFRRDDLAIDELGPHDVAGRIAHGAVIGAADAEIHFRGNDDGARRAKPMFHVFGVGERLPHQFARRVEHPRDDEVGAFRCSIHRYLHQLRAVRHCAYFFPTRIIQPTPNLSATMPKRDAKNVSASGICTCPPSASALNRRSPSVASGAVMVSAKPWNSGLPRQRPSDTSTWVSPTRTAACMTLS